VRGYVSICECFVKYGCLLRPVTERSGSHAPRGRSDAEVFGTGPQGMSFWGLLFWSLIAQALDYHLFITRTLSGSRSSLYLCSSHL
jgi:hypothetical protein